MRRFLDWLLHRALRFATFCEFEAAREQIFGGAACAMCSACGTRWLNVAQGVAARQSFRIGTTPDDRTIQQITAAIDRMPRGPL